MGHVVKNIFQKLCPLTSNLKKSINKLFICFIRLKCLFFLWIFVFLNQTTGFSQIMSNSYRTSTLAPHMASDSDHVSKAFLHGEGKLARSIAEFHPNVTPLKRQEQASMIATESIHVTPTEAETQLPLIINLLRKERNPATNKVLRKAIVLTSSQAPPLSVEHLLTYYEAILANDFSNNRPLLRVVQALRCGLFFNAIAPLNQKNIFFQRLNPFYFTVALSQDDVLDVLEVVYRDSATDTPFSRITFNFYTGLPQNIEIVWSNIDSRLAHHTGQFLVATQHLGNQIAQRSFLTGNCFSGEIKNDASKKKIRHWFNSNTQSEVGSFDLTKIPEAVIQHTQIGRILTYLAFSPLVLQANWKFTAAYTGLTQQLKRKRSPQHFQANLLPNADSRIEFQSIHRAP